MNIPFDILPAQPTSLETEPGAQEKAAPSPACPDYGQAGAGQLVTGAARLFNEGRRFMLLFDLEGYKEAVFCFMQVRDALPEFCPVYSAIAETYAYWGFRHEISGLDPSTFYGLAYENAERALDLDLDSGEAHRAMALALRSGPRRNPARRLAEAKRAIEINPYSAENCWEAWRAGGSDTKDAAITRALALDPSLCGAQNDLGIALSEAGDDEEALYHLAEAERLNPRNALVHYNTAMVLYRKGLWDQAMRRLKHALTIHPQDRLLTNGVDLLLGERMASLVISP